MATEVTEQGVSESGSAKKPGRKAAMWLVVYAVALVAGGLFAIAFAPDKGRAVTAVAIPRVCAVLVLVCALMASLLGKSRAVGMIGIHLGLVLPLVFAVGLFMQGRKALAEVDRFEEAEAAWVAMDEGERGGLDRAAHFEAADAPDHNTWYKAAAQLRLGVASVLAFGLVLTARPKKSDRG